MKSTNNEEPTAPARAEAISWRAGGCLLLLLAVALALRLWGINHESAWWDEYTSLKYVHAPALGQFLTLNRTLDPATLPLYYAFEYGWWHHVWASVFGLRCFSILLGLAGIAALFDLGRRLFGVRAGLIAAACMALSPIHTFHAQGIRMYVLLTLLAILSVRTFVEAAEGGRKRWWLAHALVNFMLLWTHPFAALLIAAEGVALPILAWPRIRRIAGWGLLHGMLALPSAWYFMTVRFWPAQQTEGWLKLPGPVELLGDMLADDVLSWTYQLRVCADAFHFLGPRSASILLAAHPILDVLFFALCAGAVALSLVMLFRNRPQRSQCALLLLWLLLPPCILLIASLLYRPCMFPRYTLYCSLALYLLMGAALGGIRSARLRGALLCALLLCFVYQASLAHPGPQRTDWQGAARAIQSQAGPDDVVLVHIATWKDVFLYNAGAIPQALASAETFETLADEAMLLAHHFAQDTKKPERKVWVLAARPYFDFDPESRLEAPLAQCHAAFTRRSFPSIEPLLLYQVEAGRMDAPPPPLELTSDGLRHDYCMANGMLAAAFAAKHDTEDALAMLSRLTDIDTQFSEAWSVFGNLKRALETGRDGAQEIAAVHAYIEGAGFSENANKELAAQAFRRALQSDPNYLVAAHALIKLGDLDVAAGALKSMNPQSGDIAVLWYQFARALIQRNAPTDREVAFATLKRLPDIEQPNSPNERLYGGLLRAMQRGEAAAPFVEAVDAFLLGGMENTAGHAAQAADAYRRATELDPKYEVAWFGLARALVAMGKDGANAPAVDSARREWAATAFRRALDADSGYLTMADALLEIGYLEQAAGVLKASERKSDDITVLWFKLAQAFVARNTEKDRISASDALQQIPEIDTAGTPHERLYGNFRRALQRNEEAGSRAEAVTAYLQGGLEAEGPSSEQAANDFRRATELDPQLDLAWPALAKTLLALEAEKTANDADSDFRQVAASAFHRALQAHTGYQVMADTLLEVGYLDELAATLNDDHQPDDDITAIRFRVARALIPRNTKRDVATALETLKHIPKIDAPGAPNARLYGRVLHALQQGENAQPCADAVWEFLQGGMAVNNNQAVQAVEHYRRATALDPHLDVAWHALGRVLVAQNDLKAAGPVFQHVVDANPGDAIIYSHLADAVARGGDAKRALEATDTLLRGIGAMERKDYEGLRAAVEDALRQDDTYGLAHLVRGVFVDFREGREAGLIDAMHRAFALDATVAHYWKPFFTALLETKDYTVARNELHRLEKLGIPPPEPLVERLRTASGHKQ